MAPISLQSKEMEMEMEISIFFSWQKEIVSEDNRWPLLTSVLATSFFILPAAFPLLKRKGKQGLQDPYNSNASSTWRNCKKETSSTVRPWFCFFLEDYDVYDLGSVSGIMLECPTNNYLAHQQTNCKIKETFFFDVTFNLTLEMKQNLMKEKGI